MQKISRTTLTSTWLPMPVKKFDRRLLSRSLLTVAYSVSKNGLAFSTVQQFLQRFVAFKDFVNRCLSLDKSLNRNLKVDIWSHCSNSAILQQSADLGSYWTATACTVYLPSVTLQVSFEGGRRSLLPQYSDEISLHPIMGNTQSVSTLTRTTGALDSFVAELAGDIVFEKRYADITPTL